MIENEVPKSLSLTALTKYINDTTGKNIHRDTVLYVLIKKKFVEDIKTITDEGLKNGVSYAYDRYRSNIRWPVYDHTVQDMFIKNIDAIIPIDDKLRAKREAEKAEREAAKKAEKEAQRKAKHTHSPSTPILTNKTTTFNFKDDTMRFPYLHLDDFVLIDTESSGLSKTAEIVELAVVSTSGEVLYESTFYPTVEVDPMASKVNGFTRKNLAGSPLFKDEWEKIEKAIDGHRILCHNTPFDKRLMKQTCERYGISADVDFMFRDSYDSKEIAKDWMNAPDYSIETLYHMLGGQRPEAHKAADDCLMTLETLCMLENAIRIKNEVLK